MSASRDHRSVVEAMKVAAVYDIHGNLPALEAVLEEIRQEKPDLVVVGGDVFPGPMPEQTMRCLSEVELPMQFIQGNGDREMLAAKHSMENTSLLEEAREALRWVAQELPSEYENMVASWPKSVAFDISGLGRVLFCHATPRNDTEIFTRLTPQEILIPVFDGLQASLVVCGHTHMQFDRTVGSTRVINAGSVGMPFGEPGAYWLLLGPHVQFRRTNYNPAAAAERIRQTRYPQADVFADKNVLHPPTEQEMLTAFERAALR